ncbi:IS5 family transposase [Streptomyces spectabilis]|uniref:Transposase IS4-like domain-containing protein n=1 Tax=Streptomyces spectabilis TaxID=68270 RepID=A0A7W8AVI1_STRST|nr:hypothetical protein [Streptomyces spectabilis]GGV21492.1 IS5 family transposase [Streptomyces spectabilis]
MTLVSSTSPRSEPVDRRKPGTKMHILSDENGLPLLVGVSAANVHDSEGLKPMVEGHQTQHDSYRGRCFKPQRLPADKAYDIPHLRKWLWGKHIGVCIARKGIECSERMGRRRWVLVTVRGDGDGRTGAHDSC